MFRLSKDTRAKIDEARTLAGSRYKLIAFFVEHENKGIQVYAMYYKKVDLRIYSTKQNLSDDEVRRRCTAFREYLEEVNDPYIVEPKFSGYTVAELRRFDRYTLQAIAEELGITPDSNASVDALVEAITC